MSTVLLFPGQSSRYPRMLEWPLQQAPELAERLLEESSSLLGRDLRALYHPQNPSMFTCNRDIQIGVFLANHFRFLLLERAGVSTPYSLGLSLGEYNHLVHIGALSFEDALLLINKRGEIYDLGPRGAMAAVFPLPYEELLPVVERARAAGSLEVAIFNSPTQHVLAGDRDALDAALTILDDELFVQGRIIEERLPMHCSTFSPASIELKQALEKIPWRSPRSPYFPNVLGAPIPNTAPQHFIDLLTRHVHDPVLWRQSLVRAIEVHGDDTVFVEVGPGRVLSELSKRWMPCKTLHTDNAEGFQRVLDAVTRGAHVAA
jgi:[acyl-carrier-protein] S-malonyltransferase